ncbi:Uncharacterized OsmC-related protein [Pelagirhabdus alkalitolerans]|uniref:Uncharacterized OsmC-related protein n=1 Tax=Pelagirhabdus alkalitolerans TaxID=1612202 RepID=A0A1G6GMP0_9BACI|nr:OsmC family protein [Pelagirhabdus alkalitolerans]SDB82456.1 Uncharacterized OsmC-related protein [Pelagirhabdus alkalitolerans]
MITLNKRSDQAHEIENEKGSISYGASSKTDVDGFSPVDYLCSSVAMCIGLTLDAIIERDQIDIEGYKIDVSVTKDPDARPSRMKSMAIHVEFNGELEEKTRKKLEKSAKRGCTIGHTLEHGIAIDMQSEVLTSS